ncbi:MAG: nucleoside deaminase [Eubacteriales bacterium]|nr:nucleoside deaminase [Eubacteriales bacterium]
MYNEFMEQALALAKEAYDEGEVPVGAVIVKNGEIISTGRNRRETSKNALSHAEIEAINKACEKLGGWRLWECDIYVTLEPCPMCSGAIVNARIPNVYFGAYDKNFGCCGSTLNILEMPNSFHPHFEGGIMEDECSKILTDFFKNLRKK